SLDFPDSSILQMGLVGLAIYGAYRCWTSKGVPSRRLQAAIMLGLLVSLAITTAQQIYQAPFYGTDEIAFGQYAARLVLDGVNPYTHSLAPSLSMFHVPTIFTTHFLDGHSMTRMSYPAGSFLFYLPALALGWSAQMAVVVDVIFWAGAMLMMWILLPEKFCWIAALFLASSFYASFMIGGVSDCLYIPFVLLAVWRWDRYAAPGERSIARWVGPVALAIAMSVKQTPWFLLPFLLVGVAFEAYSAGLPWWRRSGRYLATVAGVFGAINLPWIVVAPGAWFTGSVGPLRDSFVPLGQGLINLTIINRLGGGNLSFYTYAGACWLLFALVLLALRYRRFKRLWMFLVIASFFFTPRSLANYFLMLLPGAILGVMTVAEASGDGPLGSWNPTQLWLAEAAAGSASVGVVVALSFAVTSSPPLSLKVLEVRTDGQQEQVTQAIVQIRNLTDTVQHPSFAVSAGNYLTNFWTPVGSTVALPTITIPPRHAETLTLQAPDTSSMPAVQAPFQMLAYTTTPHRSVSSSAAYTSSGSSLYLTPDSVDQPIRVGVPVRLTAQLDDRFGRSIHKAGVLLELGQVIYAQDGLLAGSASINGHPEGQSPIGAVTDAGGRATFVVVGRQVSAGLVSFQAWMSSSEPLVPPTGYSQIVGIRYIDTG
ncbi:MAG TPA: hypothetical protein VHT30_12375, partial [Acidimicrobiales bacterium]|nr:hypothetical protein [Acidimicrobiales bacterium]